MESIPVLVIGVGSLGRGRARMVKEAGGFELAGVCDTNEATVQAVGDEFGVRPARRYLDPAAACSESGADLTVLVTPPEDHADGVALAFDAGQNVLCSKPLCENVEDALRIRDLVREHASLRFMVDQNARWSESVEAVRQAVQSGLIGRLGYITWEFEQAWVFGGWRDRMAEVMLADLSVHHFDLIRYITGLEAVEVYAHSFNPWWSWYEGNSCASAILEMEDGVHVNYLGVWSARGDAAWGSAIRIAGGKGAIQWPQGGAPVAVLGRPENDRDDIVVEPLAPAPLEHTNFLYGLYEIGAAIRERRDPVMCTIDDNLGTMAMVIAACESSHNNLPVRLETLGLV